MRFSPLFLVITAAGTTFTAITSQQEPAQQPPRSSTAQEPSSTSTEQNDAILATWLLVDNNNEVALAELAQQRAENPEVKQFAQKVVTAHRQMGEQLQPFAAPGLSAPAADSKGLAGGTDGRPQEASASKAAIADELDHLALLEELGDQCLSSARKELEQKQGPDFDRCFMGMAVGGHMKVNDAMTVFQKHVSAQLKGVITDGQKTVQMHLQHAKDLSKQLQSDATKAPEK